MEIKKDLQNFQEKNRKDHELVFIKATKQDWKTLKSILLDKIDEYQVIEIAKVKTEWTNTEFLYTTEVESPLLYEVAFTQYNTAYYEDEDKVKGTDDLIIMKLGVLSSLAHTLLDHTIFNGYGFNKKEYIFLQQLYNLYKELQ